MLLRRVAATRTHTALAHRFIHDTRRRSGQLHCGLLLSSHSASRTPGDPTPAALLRRADVRVRMSSDATVDLEELLTVCVDLAARAGEAIRAIFDSGRLSAIDKDDSGAASSGVDGEAAGDARSDIVDPQTAADLESQRIIIGNMARLWPTMRIVGEEGELDNAVGAPEQGRVQVQRHSGLAAQFNATFPDNLRAIPIKDLCVWVDPLDGTKEFTLGYVHYVTVLIGISVRGRALAGVVHVPFTGGNYQRKHDPLNHRPHAGEKAEAEAQKQQAAAAAAASASGSSAVAASPPGQTIWGAVGVGTFGVQQLPAPPASRRFITTTRTHFSPALGALLQRMRPDEVIRCGGAGSKGLLVLSREADVYLFPQAGTKRWDSCAIDACIRAAGGQFTDMHGDDIVYDPDARSFENSTGILATLQGHQQYVLPKEERQEKANL